MEETMARDLKKPAAPEMKELVMPEMEEPAPKPRFLDQMMNLYVRIGSYVGMGIAAAAFFGICALSWALFYRMLIPPGYYLAAGIMACATIALAGIVAVGVFFWSSIMWLPALLGLWFMALLSIPVLARLHH